MPIDIAKFKSDGVIGVTRTRTDYHLYEKLKAKNGALTREEVGEMIGLPLENGWQNSNGNKVWAMLKSLRLDGKVVRRYIDGIEYFAVVSGDIKPEIFSEEGKAIARAEIAELIE